jgi:hypothetical protein
VVGLLSRCQTRREIPRADSLEAHSDAGLGFDTARWRGRGSAVESARRRLWAGSHSVARKWSVRFDGVVPQQLIGRLYTKRNDYQGAARFRLTKDQTVTVAMYEWGHEHEGNPSGNWMTELTSRRDIAKMGWQPVGEIKARHTTPELPGATSFLYTRDCKADESFLLRNHKYQAPLVFSEKLHSEDGPINAEPSPLEKHAQRQAEERLSRLAEEIRRLIDQQRFAEANQIAQQAKREFPMCPMADTMSSIFPSLQDDVNSSAQDDQRDESVGATDSVAAPKMSDVRLDVIRLDGSKMQSQVAAQVGEPGVFGTYGAGAAGVKLPEFYLRRQTETPRDGLVSRDGYGLLLGQIPIETQVDDRFELERFDRTGNQLRVVFRQHTTNPVFSAVTNQGGVFIDPSAAGSLAASWKRDMTRIEYCLSDGKRRKLLSNPLSGDGSESEPKLGTFLLSRVVDRRHLAGIALYINHLDRDRVVPRRRIEQARTALPEEVEWYKTRLQHPRLTIDVNKDQQVREAEYGLMVTAYRLAMCTREEALTHSIGSQQYQSLMRRSAAEFEKVYDKSRSQFVGLHGRLWQAACLCDAGEFEMATRICNEMLKLPTTTPNIKTLHARAMHFLLVAMIDGQLDEPKKAVELAGEWLSKADKGTRRSDSAACVMWE